MLVLIIYTIHYIDYKLKKSIDTSLDYLVAGYHH